MPLLYDLIYLLAFLFALPLLIRKSRKTGKYKTGLSSRFGFGDDLFPHRKPHQKLLLLHCVSVGELLSIQALTTQLLAADPNLLIAISTSTDTGTARAKILYPPEGHPTHNPRLAICRFPLDFSFAVESFFDRVRPDAVALVELETWPNFLAIAQSRRIPVAIINGRLSTKSFPRYQLIRPLMKSMLKKITFLGAQTQTIADRFLALGANPNTIQIIPTLKYDNAHLANTIPGQEQLANAIALLPTHHLFVAGSIAPGEETPILESYLKLRNDFPNLRLAIAPRHPEALPQMLAAITSRKLTPILRSERPDSSFIIYNSEFRIEHVFVLNTLGELKKLYALASSVFVGRSLLNLGGSDMIEVAALAKPLCFGPHTQNFAEAVDLLLDHNAALEVSNEFTLTQTLKNWLETPPEAKSLGHRAQQLIAAQRGSTKTYTQTLLHLLKLQTSP